MIFLGFSMFLFLSRTAIHPLLPLYSHDFLLHPDTAVLVNRGVSSKFKGTEESFQDLFAFFYWNFLMWDCLGRKIDTMLPEFEKVVQHWSSIEVKIQ